MANISRNSLCICGSGKKYKRCCLDGASKTKNKEQNPHFVMVPKTSSSRFLINHPSLPNIYNDAHDSLVYQLGPLKMENFLLGFAKGKSQKELDYSLIQLNKKSPLSCLFSRSGERIYFTLYNKNADVQLQIDAGGKIYIRPLQNNEIPVDVTIYLLYRLITDENCSWNIEKIKKNWAMNATIAKSLFNFKNTQSPILLEGIILKTNAYSESQIIKIGESTNNLNYLNLTSIHVSANDEAKTTLFPIDENGEDLFSYIQYGNPRVRYWWEKPNSKKEVLSILNHVNFIFNDKTIYSLKEILNHPYSVFLPKDLIPEKLSLKNKISDYDLWDNSYSENWEYSEKIVEITKMFLSSFINLNDFKASRLKFYLSSFKHESFANVPCLLVEKIKFLEEKNNYSWKIFDNEIIGCLNRAENETFENSFFHFQKDEKIMILNLFSKQKEVFKKLIKKFGISTINEKDNMISVKMEKDVDVQKFKEEFDENISERFHVCLNLDGVLKIPDDRVLLNIFLEEQVPTLSHISFNIEIAEDGNHPQYHLTAIPKQMYRCLRGFGEGIGNFYYEYDNKDLATQSQGNKRKNDLKLLRHSGYFRLLVAEIIRYLDTPVDKREKVKDFEKSLIQKALLLLSSSSSVLKNESDDLSLGKMLNENDDEISSRVKGKIKEFCHMMFDSNIEEYLFLNGSKIYQVNLKKPMLKLMESILEWGSYIFGESLFAKIQIKELIYEENYYPNSGAILTKKETTFIPFFLYESVELTRGVLATMGRNLSNVYLSGQKIEALKEDYFSSSIFMGESNHKINWFDLHPEIFFNGKQVTYDQLQEMKEKDIIFFEGMPYYIDFNKMPKLKFLDRFWAKLKNTKALRKDQSNANSIYRQEKSLQLEVLSMRNAGININSCEEWKKICDNFDSLMSNKIDDLARADFKVPLKDYQKIGTQWLLNLYKIGLGGVLADDMGLGKTIQIIGLLEILRLQNNSDFHLVVVPTSLIYNWTSEIKKFAPLLEVEVFESKLKIEYEKRWKKNPPKVIIATYGLLVENDNFLNQYSWNSVSFDEAQNLKNISSQRSSAARSLQAKSTFCITGTPMENHYGEFYSLIDLCVPGALGEYQDFRKAFSVDTLSTQKTAIQKQLLQDEIKFLKIKTSPLVLRRMKSEILEQLPEKSESLILIPFEKRQKEIYRNIAISWNDKIKSVIDENAQSNTQLQMLTALLRLRQVCSFPSMVDKVEYNKIPPKFDLLFESVAEIYEKNESILIFTNFVTTLEEIKKYFQENGYRTYSIHGSMNAKKRQVELENFQQNSGASILIMTLKTGGVGLNLTKANYVFHIEPWWNPAVENQGTDRAYRIGQTKSVQVYRYLMKDSVEEKIQDLKSIKGQAFDALFKEESEGELLNHQLFKGQLTYNDFQYLLN